MHLPLPQLPTPIHHLPAGLSLTVVAAAVVVAAAAIVFQIHNDQRSSFPGSLLPCRPHPPISPTHPSTPFPRPLATYLSFTKRRLHSRLPPILSGSPHFLSVLSFAPPNLPTPLPPSRCFLPPPSPFTPDSTAAASSLNHGLCFDEVRLPSTVVVVAGGRCRWLR